MTTVYALMSPKRLDDVQALVTKGAHVVDIRTDDQVGDGVSPSALDTGLGSQYEHSKELAGTTMLGKWQPDDPKVAATKLREVTKWLQDGEDVVIIGTRRTASECAKLIHQVVPDTEMKLIDGRKRSSVYGAEESVSDTILGMLTEDGKPNKRKAA